MVILPLLAWSLVIPSLLLSALSTGIAVVASLLLSKSPPKTPFDRKPTTLAQRGSILPDLIGRRRLGYIFGWAGNRVLIDLGDSGGKNFGGSPAQSNQEYREAAWHSICVGPVDVLHGIYLNGRQIWKTVLSRDTTPSGSLFTLPGGHGHFFIYWGECNQPVNTFLHVNATDGNGNAVPLSRWPRIMYIVWARMPLGSTPYWGQMEYDIEKYVTSDSATLVDSPAYMNESGAGFGNNGINPAHAVWKVMTGKFPDGTGLDPTFIKFDETAFESLGVTFNTEHTPMNAALLDGQPVDSFLQDVMDEFQFTLVQRGDTLTVIPIRTIADISTIPQITVDLRQEANPEIERIHGGFLPDRLSFFIRDKKLQFNDYPIRISNDTSIRKNGRPKAHRIDFKCITDRFTGFTIAERKVLEYLDRFAYSFTGQRETRVLLPGQPFNLVGVGVMRLSSILPKTETYQCDIQCLLDQYSLSASGYLPTDPRGGLGDDGVAAQDLIVRPFAIPNLGSIKIGVARVRANQNILGSQIWASDAAAGVYTFIGNQDIASAGGTLNAPIFSTQTSPIPIGPTIAPYNDDIQDLPDLTGNFAAWHGGTVDALIDDEIFFLESVTAVTGGYQMNNMLRPEEGTTAADHADNTPVVIFPVAIIRPLAAPSFAPGTTVWIKSVPFTNIDIVDISLVPPVPVVLGINILAVIQITAPNGGEDYTDGVYYSITWLSHQFSGSVDIFYSNDDGTTWIPIATGQPDTGIFSWLVPNDPTSLARVKVQSTMSPSIFDVSNHTFTIL